MRTMLSIVAAAAALAGTAQAADVVKAAIGQRGLWDTSVIVQGIEQGFYKKENIEVEVTWTRGGAETLQAVITGSADVAVANGILGVIGAYAKGAPVRIYAAQTTGSDDLFWYVKADSPIRTLKDLDGRTMAYSRPGSSTHLVALVIGDHAGIKPKLISAGGVPDTRTQVMSGQIDAGWSVPPFNLDLVSEGKVRIIARGSEVPSLAEQTVRVNAASVKFLTERRDLARRFAKVYVDTLDWMYAHPEQSIAFYAQMNKVSFEVARKGVEFYPKAALAVAPVKGWQQNLDQALEQKMLEKAMSVAEAEKMIDFVYRPPGS